MTDFIQVGRIINTHGIKGEVKVIPLTDDPHRFDDLEGIYVDNGNTKLEIDYVWYKKNMVYLKFKSYDNINDVLKFKNDFILIKENQLIDLPEDAYFIYQIIGLNVYTVNGEKVGEVINVLQPGANDVYVVKNVDKQYLIPAIKDVIKKIDIENGKMVIEPIKGLIE